MQNKHQVFFRIPNSREGRGGSSRLGQNAKIGRKKFDGSPCLYLSLPVCALPSAFSKYILPLFHTLTTWGYFSPVMVGGAWYKPAFMLLFIFPIFKKSKKKNFKKRNNPTFMLLFIFLIFKKMKK